MTPLLSDDEKQLLSDMVDVDRQTGSEDDKSFYLIPGNFSSRLPTLSHSYLQYRKAVQEGMLSALVDAGYLRRVKWDAQIPWYEVAEAGRRYIQRMRSGEPEEEGVGFRISPQINYYTGANMSTTIRAICKTIEAV